MIIDTRLRPAIPAFQDSTVNLAGVQAYHKRFGMGELGESAKKCSMDLLLQEMEEAGITYACATARWGWGTEPMVSPETVVQVMKDYPDRFYGAIAVSGHHVRKSLEMIEKFVVNGPVKAVSIEPAVGDLFINDKRIYPIYDFLQEEEIPAFITTGGGVGSTIAFANPEHLDSMLNDFPKLTVIGSHAGVPFVDQDIFCAFRRPNYFPSPDIYLSNTPYAAAYVHAANYMLKDQIVFGTAYPFVSIVEYTRYFLSLPFRKEILENILWKNANRALKLNFQVTHTATRS